MTVTCTIGPVDLASMATERLEAEITTLAAHMAAAMCQWLLLVAEYDRRRAYESWECVSMAQWLGVHVGVSAVTARQHVAVARRLEVLPKVCEAFARGEVSFSRVRAICRIATPSTEASLLTMARVATAAQMDRIAADTARALRAAQPGQAARQAEARRLSWWFDEDGMCRVRGVLPPEIGALLADLVKEEREHEPDTATDLEQRNADALGVVLARARACPSGAEAEVRPLIVVHRDRDGTARIEHGPPIPAEVADRLSCDGEHVDAVHDTPDPHDPGHDTGPDTGPTPGPNPGHDTGPDMGNSAGGGPDHDGGIHFGRRRRFPTKSMRRRLRERDGGCAFPGCSRRRGVQAHHVAHYGRDRGETVIDNLIELCLKHHRAVHDRGWTIEGNAEQGWCFQRPDGQAFTTATTATGDLATLLSRNEQLNIRAGPTTITPTGLGERYDHEMTIWAITNYWPENEPPGWPARESDAAASPHSYG